MPTAPRRFIVVDITSPAWQECRMLLPTSFITMTAGFGAVSRIL